MKKVPILQFLLNFCDFGPIFNFDAKIQVYKMNLWSRWFFGMKVHCIRSVYNQYQLGILTKSSFEKNSSVANMICMINTDIPLKKRNFWKNVPKVLNFSSNDTLHALMIWWKNQQNPSTKSRVTFFNGKFLVVFRDFHEIFLNI